ncbi:MAG: hypothetical protein JXA10_18535, partial [Anaerolineae bacterium]|nr:hypothetical protein [Anaerolineae bacterium]
WGILTANLVVFSQLCLIISLPQNPLEPGIFEGKITMVLTKSYVRAYDDTPLPDKILLNTAHH